MKPIRYELWYANVRRTMQSARGQDFLHELLQALDAQPRKRLVMGAMQRDGDACALGAIGVRRGIEWKRLDIRDYDAIGRAFGISALLAEHIIYWNDTGMDLCLLGLDRALTPEERFSLMRAWIVARLGSSS